MKFRELSGSDISKGVGQGLSTYYVPGNILDTEHTILSKQTKVPVLGSLYSSVEEEGGKNRQ